MTEVIHVSRYLLAEGEGFEPPEPFPVQWFSRPPPSTTRPSLRIEITPESARLFGDQGVGRPRVTRSVTIGRTPDDTPQRIVAARRSVVLAFRKQPKGSKRDANGVKSE